MNAEGGTDPAPGRESRRAPLAERGRSPAAAGRASARAQKFRGGTNVQVHGPDAR
jgi:hypothetical protein